MRDPNSERLQRLRSYAWLLDESIPLPGGYRIGLDALLGLIPGLGDALSALFSAAIINEARAMGAPRSVLLRMIGNVLIDTVVGSVPIFGDVFDAAYKANARNLELLTRYHFDPIGTRRSSRSLVVGFALLLLMLVLVALSLPVLLVIGIAKLL